MSYLFLKQLHILCILLSLSLFVFRLQLAVRNHPRLQQRWLKILPHCIDTLLLISGVALAYHLHQTPFVNSPWLSAKLVGLLLYIVAGTFAIKRAPSARGRLGFGLLAVGLFAYIVAVAASKQTWPWLSLL